MGSRRPRPRDGALGCSCRGRRQQAAFRDVAHERRSVDQALASATVAEAEREGALAAVAQARKKRQREESRPQVRSATTIRSACTSWRRTRRAQNSSRASTTSSQRKGKFVLGIMRLQRTMARSSASTPA